MPRRSEVIYNALFSSVIAGQLPACKASQCCLKEHEGKANDQPLEVFFLLSSM